MHAELLALLRTPACIVSGSGVITGDFREPAPLVDAISPQDRAVVAELLRPGDTGPIECECRLLDGAGSPRWHIAALHPLHGGWLLTTVDISRVKRAEESLARSSDLQKRLLDASMDCFKLISPDGTLVAMNEAGCHALGVQSDSGFGMNWLDLLPEEVRRAGKDALAAAQAGSPARFDGRSQRGVTVQFWDNALTPIKDAEGSVIAIVCVSRDITAERVALDEIRQGQARLTLAAHVGGLGVWDYDISRDVLHCDDGWYRVMRRDPLRPISSVEEFRPMIHPEDVDHAVEVHRTAAELVASGLDYTIDYRILWPTGDVRWVRSAACLITDLSGAAVRAIGFIVDITDSRREEIALRDDNMALEEAKSELLQQSRLDPLTGIANRRQLDLELAHLCGPGAGTTTAATVGMIDVDHFKAFNDYYGHLEGDRVLCLIADSVQSLFRRARTVARYGGEEFVFILPGGEDPTPQLRQLAAVIHDLDIPHAASSFGRITISCVAVAVLEGEQSSPEGLLAQCDRTLYEAKELGRDTFVVRPATPARGPEA